MGFFFCESGRTQEQIVPRETPSVEILKPDWTWSLLCWTYSEEKPQSHGASSDDSPPSPLKGIVETAPVLGMREEFTSVTPRLAHHMSQGIDRVEQLRVNLVQYPAMNHGHRQRIERWQRTNTNSCPWEGIIPGKDMGWDCLAGRKALLALPERLWGHGGQQAGHELQRALAARKANSILGHSQDTEGNNYSSLLSTCYIQLLHLILGPQNKKDIDKLEQWRAIKMIPGWSACPLRRG
ncbi:hypothetical protein QYF61_000399 [Mycteria americana]|uniref:Uncharacterized protein n=1 Tax=Mycteria americana TaxID=33587 RepID=A0AAN7N906_MYCAM|nr:hypothetical protein QYF61_000399 [Mycteria americana]